MRFTKMQGTGNDYVYVDGFSEKVADPVALARKISDRHFGVGSDGLILILPSKTADVRMRMFNADGSESEMCGNGVRCVAKYAFDHQLTKRNPMRVETGHGVLTLALDVVRGKTEQVTVNMGEPILDLPSIPVNPEKVTRLAQGTEPSGSAAGSSAALSNTYRVGLMQGNDAVEAVFVSMGNPHAVIFVDDVAAVELERVGPMLENHPAFPNRMNVHFVQVEERDEVTVRTWERGTGVTLACGTGACAVAVAGVLTDRTDRRLLTHLPGGDLVLEWQADDNHVYMTGPAAEVFTGVWDPVD